MRHLIKQSLNALRHTANNISGTLLAETDAKTVTSVRIRTTKCVKNEYKSTEEGSALLDRQMLANELFQGYSWMPPVLEQQNRSFVRPFYPEKCRLDKVVSQMSQETRKAIAGQAVSIIFDIFCAGYTHRNSLATNFYRTPTGLVLTDFENLQDYGQSFAPAFPLSYDMTRNNSGAFEGSPAAYDSDHPMSLQNVLNVPLKVAVEAFEADLRDSLRKACSTFATSNRRHTCKAGLIYSSFQLPFLSVTRQQAQRDSRMRLETFGIHREHIQGKRILDLGSNIGGILFELQKYQPAESVGVEYDAEKVNFAKKISRYNGLSNTQFLQADIDFLDADTLRSSFDVVFCLAIEAHVNKPRRLFKLLSKVTSGTLFFEGNGNADRNFIQDSLARAGFKNIEYLGFNNDDCRVSNNNRPMFRARKK